MTLDSHSIAQFLSAIHPYDAMEPAALQTLIDSFEIKPIAAGDAIYALNAPLDGLFVVYQGDVEIRDEHDVAISLLGPRNSFGERGLLRDGNSLTSARAVTDSIVLMLPATRFHQAMTEDPAFRRFFNRGRGCTSQHREPCHHAGRGAHGDRAADLPTRNRCADRRPPDAGCARVVDMRGCGQRPKGYCHDPRSVRRGGGRWSSFCDTDFPDHDLRSGHPAPVGHRVGRAAHDDGAADRAYP